MTTKEILREGARRWPKAYAGLLWGTWPQRIVTATVVGFNLWLPPHTGFWHLAGRLAIFFGSMAALSFVFAVDAYFTEQRNEAFNGLLDVAKERATMLDDMLALNKKVNEFNDLLLRRLEKYEPELAKKLNEEVAKLQAQQVASRN